MPALVLLSEIAPQSPDPQSPWKIHRICQENSVLPRAGGIQTNQVAPMVTAIEHHAKMRAWNGEQTVWKADTHLSCQANLPHKDGCLVAGTQTTFSGGTPEVLKYWPTSRLMLIVRLK